MMPQDLDPNPFHHAVALIENMDRIDLAQIGKLVLERLEEFHRADAEAKDAPQGCDSEAPVASIETRCPLTPRNKEWLERSRERAKSYSHPSGLLVINGGVDDA